MNRKILIIIVLILATGVSMFFYSKYFEKLESKYEMVGGTIKEVKENSIIIEGLVRPLDPKDSFQEQKTVEFTIISGTVLKKSLISATIEQMKSGESFHPETKITEGSMSDLVAGMSTSEIKSPDDLSVKDKAVASEINYIIYDFPSPSTP